MNAYQRGQKLLCGGYSSYTPTGKSYFAKAGRYGKVPHEGDIIYFYTSSLGRISHVGIVAAVQLRNGLYHLDAIEGNTAAGIQFERDGGSVALKHYEFLPAQVGAQNRIDGFGTPAFGAETCSAQQLLAIARSQIGYVEKASNRNLDEPRANPGAKNWTKYGAWYGLNPAQWCQMFVSWCAYMACKSAHDYQAGWIRQDDGSWTYRKDGGSICRDEWLHYGGRWYVFDGSGIMIRGWFRQADGWYFLADDGAMCSGQWVTRDGESYYLTKSGLMATSCYVRSEKPFAPLQYIYYWVDASGRWIPAEDTERPDLKLYEVAE